jgi:hypothetical protein
MHLERVQVTQSLGMLFATLQKALQVQLLLKGAIWSGKGHMEQCTSTQPGCQCCWMKQKEPMQLKSLATLPSQALENKSQHLTLHSAKLGNRS